MKNKELCTRTAATKQHYSNAALLSGCQDQQLTLHYPSDRFRSPYSFTAMKTLLFFVVISVAATLTAHGQIKVGTNPATLDPNAVLEIESTTKGMLLPRMTATQRDAISNPTNAMLIYNTSQDCINIYSEAETQWKSLCGAEADGTATFEADCSSLVVSGNYSTGVALDPDSNYITITVNVSDTGSYNIFSNSGGMYFAATGNFSTPGPQDIVLAGQGYPLVAGTTFLALNINNQICTTVINVTSGIATVTGCGSGGALTGGTQLIAGTAIDPGSVYFSYTAGPAYTGGNVYGVTSAPSNGIRIYSPVNGTFAASGAPIDYLISGTPIQPGNTNLNYSVNGFACSFTVPVLSGTGFASAVNCAVASSGPNGIYQVGTAMTGSNTKIVALTVTTPGTFYIRTNTVNGIYFAGTYTAAASGTGQNVTLTAVGTPGSPSTNAYTVTVSSAATTFTACSFNVTTTLPASVPDYPSLSCAALSASVSYIKATNAQGGDHFSGDRDNLDRFGQSTKMSADGLTLAVGASLEDGDIAGGNINSTNNNSKSNAGAVYIYTRITLADNWVAQAKLKPTVLDANDYFGNALSISNDGNTLVVGALGEDGGGVSGVNPVSNNITSNAGAAYVFTRSSGTWSQQAYLKSNAQTVNDYFGTSVAVSGDGNTVAVGAAREDGSGTGINPGVNDTKTDAGAVFTFTRSGGVWTAESYIKPDVIDAGDRFGVGISLNNDGTTLAVGAFQEDCSNQGINQVSNNSASNAGAAYIFKKTSGTWGQEAYIKAGNVSAGDEFGVCVSLDGTGNTLVVGSVLEDGNGTGVNPAANESVKDAGAAYLFTRTGSAWSQNAYLKPPVNGQGEQFGNAVAISNDGNFVSIGAPGEDGNTGCIDGADNNNAKNSGAAYLYSKVSGNWLYSLKFKMPTKVGVTENDYLGSALSLSSDGHSIAIGAYGEDGSGSGVNPTPNGSAGDAGCVVIYTK